MWNLIQRAYENVVHNEANPGAMSSVHLIKWSYELAMGMEYLAQKKVSIDSYLHLFLPMF
jgi:hypothetical protein